MGCRGALDAKEGNPSVARGTEGVKTRVRGTEVETPFGSESRGLRTRWAIVDRERVKMGLLQKGRGQHLRGAIVAKASSSEEEGRKQMSQ